MSSSSSSPVSTFHAVQARKYGAVRDVLEFSDRALPVPASLGAHEVFIRVHSAAVNPIDWKIIKGYMQSIMPVEFPHIGGLDCAGEVVQVGKDCHRIKVGDRVLAKTRATFAEYAVAAENVTAILPASLSYSEGAAIPIAGMTSYEMLFNHIHLKPSDKLLILGGSSGTGLFAIQLAKTIGAYVATTASGKNHALLKSLSNPPDVLIDYATENWVDTLKNTGVNWNIVYDCIGDQKDVQRAKQILKSGDRFYSIANFMQKDVTEFEFKFFAGAPKEETWKGLDEIVNLIDSKKVKIVIDKVFPFSKEGVEQALMESESGRTRGKIVIEMQKPKVPTKTLATK